MGYTEYVYDKEYDVIVCGGGTSGVAAAICSARTGAKTLLIERVGQLGGQMCFSGPPGFAYARLFNMHGEQCMAGIIEETHKRLLKEGHALPHCMHPYRRYSGYSFSYVDPEWWGLMIYDMMEESGVELLLHSLVVDVIKDGDSVTGVVVENANGRVSLRGKIVIECTGEGDIAVRAGCDYEYIDRDMIQPHSLAFTAAGVDWEKVLSYIHENPEELCTRPADSQAGGQFRSKEETLPLIMSIKNPTDFGEMMGFDILMNKALKNGEWHDYAGVGFFMTPKDGGVVEAHFQHSAQIGGLFTNDAWDLTRAEIECRKQVRIAFNFFKKYFPGFKNAYIVKICPELRLREGRRIMGDYKVTSDDIVNSARFYDVIGLSCMPAGGHHVANHDTLVKTGRDIISGGSWDIPYRCLVPKKVENLLVAGKHVSADRDSYMRFLQQTMVTGQAAGTAAALCIKKGITPREMEASENIKELQDELLRQGVILGGVK